MSVQNALKTLPPILWDIAQDIQNAQGTCTLVGGWVRDALLDIPCKDIDIEVSFIGFDDLQNILKKYGKPSFVGKSFGVFILRTQGLQIDFAFPRTEEKVGMGHKGFEVNSDPMLPFEIAAQRRDFTINAIGVRLPAGEIVDPFGGQMDLKNKCLRHVGPAFGEDPLRALRAVQLAARFELKVAPETVKICAEQDLSELSRERFEEEFRKLLLKAQKPSIGLKVLREMQLDRFFPELQMEEQKWQSLLIQIDLIKNKIEKHPDFYKDEELSLVLLHVVLGSALDIQTHQQFLDRFTREVKLIKRIFAFKTAMTQAEFASDDKLNDPAYFGLFQGQIRRLSIVAPIQPILMLLEALHPKALVLVPRLQVLAEQFGVWEKAPSEWILGRDLLALGLKPGAEVGMWTKRAFDRQLDGEALSKEENLEWLKAQILK